MKPATPELLAYLQTNNQVAVVDLYTFSIVNGGDHRFIDYPGVNSLTMGGLQFPGSRLNGSSTNTFFRGPGFARSKVSTKIGLQPSELDIKVYCGADTPNLINGLTWQVLASQGVFDAAVVELDRLFVPWDRAAATAPQYVDQRLGAIVWFYGKMAEVQISRTTVEFKIKSELNLLQEQQMPRRLFQSACTLVFGDAACAYDRVNGRNANGEATGIGQVVVTAFAGSDQGGIFCEPNLPRDYLYGTCTAQSGANRGLSRGIGGVNTDQVDPSLIGFHRPFPLPVQVGDVFVLLPGCDHTIGACQRYNNLLRYGGFPFIPPPETAL